MTTNLTGTVRKPKAVSISYCIDAFRKAKKRHQCNVCGKRILENEVYIVRKREFIDELPIHYVNRVLCHDCWKNS